MMTPTSTPDRGQRVLLVYADSSDEEEDLDVAESDDLFSIQTHQGHRNDSLKELVFLKETKQKNLSFNEKHRGKRLADGKVAANRVL